MNPPTYEIEVRGLTEQMTKLYNFDKIAGRHFKVAAEGSVKLLERNWKKIAPVDTGRYRSSISGRVNTARGTTVVGICGTNVVSGKGFDYPYALEHSQRYHYRRGPRQGQFTFNRVRRVLKRAQKSITSKFNKAMKGIVKDLENNANK